MTQIFLTTTGTQANTLINDLGAVTFTHPLVSLPLIQPNGEFESIDVAQSADLIAAVTAGFITLADITGNPITTLSDLADSATISLATETMAGIAEIATQAEADAGIDDTRFITPLKLANVPGLGGETNTASNLGAGVGTFDGKIGVDLQFRSLVSQNTLLTIALDGPNNEIDFTVNEGNIDHDNLAGFVANEHLDWTLNQGVNNINDDNITQSSVTQHEGAIDHDALLNFVTNEHLDWTADQGGNNINDANITASSVTQHVGSIDHDALLNFVGNEHIDHTSVTLTAGTGMTGGGDISANRTFDVVGANSIVANANDIELVNDVAAPGMDFYYGTDGSGTKGWYSIPPGMGETNTGSNLGAGVGVFDGKVGVDLQFRSLVSQNTLLTIALDGPNNEIDFTINEGNIDHDALLNFVALEHLDWTADQGGNNINDANILASSVTQHEASIDHDALLNFVSLEHLDWTADQGGNNINDANILASSVTQHEGSIDHDALLNFVANEHLDWTLDQGGNNINDANITASSVTQHVGSIDHDSLLNFVGNEHIDHTGVTLTAGTGLTGGGDISANRTFDVVGANSIVANANDIELVNDVASPGNTFYYGTNGAGTKGWYDLGASLGETNTASNLGAGIGTFDGKIGVDLQFRSLVSQNTLLTISLDAVNDEIDFTVNEGNIDHDNLAGFVPNEHLDWTVNQGANNIDDNNIVASSVTQHEGSINHDALLNFVTNEHIDHSGVTLTAGTGLTGGGDITANRTFDVVGINSIVANADDIELVNDVAAPGNNQFYGTDGTGTKGWYAIAMAGEANTASNLGAGIGVFDGKIGVDLQFRSLVSQNTLLTIALDGPNDEIDFTVNEGNIDHDALLNFVALEHLDWTADQGGNNINDANIVASSVTQHVGSIDHDLLLNFVANEHIDHTSVTLTAGTGLTGGGDISANRTFDVVGINSITANANDIELVGDVAAPGNNFFYGTNGAGTKGWYAIGPGVTNLGVANITATTLDVTSDTGTDATIPAATATLAGLLTANAQTIGGSKTFNDITVIGDAGLASPYLLSIQDQDNDGFAYIEILSDRTGSAFGGTNKGAFFGMEDWGNSLVDQEFSLYNYQGGPIVFWTDTTASSSIRRLQIENDGTVSIPGAQSGFPGTANYELLVTDDDDIPNKKYVDDAITAASGAGALQFEWRFSTGLSGDPGNGRVGYDNATPASVTEIRISDTTDNGVDINNILAAVEVGDRIYLQVLGDSTRFLLATVNSASTDNTTYWSYPVTIEDSGTLPSNNAKMGGIIVLGANTIVDLGINTTINTVEITNTAGTNATIGAATATLAGILTADAQTIGGRKTFQNDKILIDPIDAGAPATTLEIGWMNDLSPADPDSFGIRRTDGGGVFSWMSNASFPQFFMGDPNGVGEAFIDATNNRPLNLNVLDTGVGTPGRVTIGNGGLTINSVDATTRNITLETDTGGTDWDIYVGSPGNFDDWLRFSAVGSGDANEAVLLPDGVWRTKNGVAGSPAHGFINASNYGMYLGGANDLLCFSTAGVPRLNIESDGTLNVANTANYELLVTADDDVPNKKYVDDEIGALELNDLTDADTTGVVTGDVLVYDGANFSRNDLLTVGTSGCSIRTIDDTGLDWCNEQVGGAGSAFSILKKSLGTIATPLVLNNGDKIGGWGWIAFDDATSNPGYVSCEISAFATETQSATNGGAEMRFLVTANTTKTPFNALKILNDGTLTVEDQTDYELLVTADDDIPNKKYVDDVPKKTISMPVCRNAANQGNQFLRRQNGTPTNLCPYTVPFDATIYAATAEHDPVDLVPGWDFDVLVNGISVYTLNLAAGTAESTDSAVSVDVDQGDRISMQMINQTAVVDRPGGSIYLVER